MKQTKNQIKNQTLDNQNQIGNRRGRPKKITPVVPEIILTVSTQEELFEQLRKACPIF